MASKVIKIDNNEIDSSGSKANKTNKIFARFKNIKKLLKAEISGKTRYFETTYLFKFQN